MDKSPILVVPANAASDVGSGPTPYLGSVSTEAHTPVIARHLSWTHPKTGLKRSVMWWLRQKPIPSELKYSIELLIQAWNQRIETD